MFGMNMGRMGAVGGVLPFTPSKLFTGTTTGAWYDPSDTTTLFRDAAGTLPVTAVEQPVGLMKDKSGRGNHAFNSSGNSANFPVLSARYNLLTKTEQFDDAVWTKSSVTVTADAAVAPDGTTTADLVYPASSGSGRVVYQNPTLTVGVSYTISFYLKTAGFTWVGVDGTNQTNAAYFDLQNGAVGNVAAGHTATITAVGSGWYRCTVRSTCSIASSYIAARPVDANGSSTVTANGTSGIYIWGADLRVANDALNQPAYQRVNTATDYDTVGFKPYLRFNGTNQWLQTNSIDFTATDKMFVSAGVRKLSDAATGLFAELSLQLSLNNGAFYVAAPSSAASDYQFANKGTTVRSATYTNLAVASPITNVISGIGDISGDQAILRINGTQAAISTTDQGTGNYGNYPLYLGARAGSSLWFNGRLYGMVVAGKQASAAEITSTETYINQKTGAF